MKENKIILRVIFLILFAFAPITLWADDFKCNPGGNQTEMNACAEDDFDQADKELNQTYQVLIKKEANDPLFISKLRIAQKAWLAFRDADLKAIFACSEDNARICWGSMYPMLFLSHKAELTRERSKHLQQILKEGRGG